MNDSDEKLNSQEKSINETAADRSDAAFDAPSENKNNVSKADVGDIVGTSIKAVAVALSLVMLVTSILCVALPLSAMRVFNNMGMYERALGSGTRYIDGEIKRVVDKDFDLNKVGRYTEILTGGSSVTEESASRKASLPEELNNENFIEALEVCVNLSDKLVRECAAKGDVKGSIHFAEYLERYTRYYSALYGVGTVFSDKDASKRRALAAAYHPFVYSTRHTLMTLNFRARYYLDDFDSMMYYGGHNGDVLINIDNLINTYNGTNIYDPDNSVSLTVMNGFVDYVDQISEYIAIEFEKCGMTDTKLNELPETQNKYRNALRGTEFELFITKTGGFSRLYQGLKSFPSYAQAAVSYVPKNKDEQLMQLYWVQKLATAAIRMGNMEILIWINRENYGNSMNNIIDEYNINDVNTNYRHFNNNVKYSQDINSLDGVYNILMKNYING